MRFGVVGINHKLAHLKLREQFAKICQKKFGFLNSNYEEHYFILLSTCNRTEIYFCSVDLPGAHSFILNSIRLDVEDEFDQKLYSFFGSDCLNHLTRVAVGLDSAIIGETEIQGQVKLAYEAVTEYCMLPFDLHFLFQKALTISKKIRTDLQLGRGIPNLEHAIFQAGRNFFEAIDDKKILFLGASEINLRVLQFLRLKNLSQITLCNRTEVQIPNSNNPSEITYLKWSELNKWESFDWIIVGTKSPDYLITSINNQNIGRKLIIDLSVPRNVNPTLGKISNVKLLNIDELYGLLEIRRQMMNKSIFDAEHRIQEATQRHVERHEKKLSRILELEKIAL